MNTGGKPSDGYNSKSGGGDGDDDSDQGDSPAWVRDWFSISN